MFNGWSGLGLGLCQKLYLVYFNICKIKDYKEAQY